MTIRIQGTPFTLARADATAAARFTDIPTRANLPGYYFDAFFLTYVITALDGAGAAFISMSDFLLEVRIRLAALHVQLELTRTQWKGKTAPGHITFGAIPQAQQAAVRNLITNGNPAPGHDRGVHATSPAHAGGGTAREFDLTAGCDGRLTRRFLNGRIGFYFSRHHAAGTYEYLLITDSRGRPILRGFPANVLPAIPCP